MNKYSNQHNIPLPLAIFLAHDDYDHNPDPNTISTTALIKPIRQLVLSKRLKPEESITDISNIVNLRIGSAIHNSIESSWLINYKTALTALGYKPDYIERIRINPQHSNQKINPEDIPVYLENRGSKKLQGITVTGKYDNIMEEQLHDFKYTKAFSYSLPSKKEEYRLQGSVYRWLFSDLIKKDQMIIHQIYSDWVAFKTSDRNYPPSQIMSIPIDLLTLTETEQYLNQKISQFLRFRDSDQTEIPLCTNEELWRSESTWKYYKNPEKKSRSTANFNNKQDAYVRLSEEKVGVVLEVPGKVRACKYCSAFPICEQKNTYITNGVLTP